MVLRLQYVAGEDGGGGVGWEEFNPLSPSIKFEILISCLPYISNKSSGEKLLRYEENLTWVAMFSILMTSLTDKPLILQ